jgi:hypothetical protein
MDSYGDRGSDASDQGAEAGSPPRAGIAGLSFRYRVVAAVGLAVVAAIACVHLAMVFFYVAPANTLSKQHGGAIDRWVNPEFEQNWKLFAPNPLQQNIDVQVRAMTEDPEGRLSTGPWLDLSAQDGAAIRDNPLPSHTQQNELRRAWDFLSTSHDDKEKPIGTRGRLSEEYVRRIVMLRLGQGHLPGPVARIQVRSASAAVPPPSWSKERVDTRTFYRAFPWWTVGPADLPGGVPKTVIAAGGAPAVGSVAARSEAPEGAAPGSAARKSGRTGGTEAAK